MEASWMPFVRYQGIDDWTNISDAKARKKVQNRLAQRLHRMKYGRTRNNKPLAENKSGLSTRTGFSNTSQALNTTLDESYVATFSAISNHSVQIDNLDLSFLNNHLSLVPVDNSPRHEAYPTGFLGTKDTSIAPLDILSDTANPSFHQSLFTETHYITMYSLSTVSAMLINSRILNIQCSPPPKEMLIHIQPSLLTPASLAPTPLQSSQPHFPYLALIPFAALRDNLLMASTIIDPKEIWNDLSAGDVKVWGSTPWDKMGWEFGEEFVKKWWFLMSEDVIEQANFWRAGRGEGLLNISAIRSGYTSL